MRSSFLGIVLNNWFLVENIVTFCHVNYSFLIVNTPVIYRILIYVSNDVKQKISDDDNNENDDEAVCSEILSL